MTDVRRQPLENLIIDNLLTELEMGLELFDQRYIEVAKAAIALGYEVDDLQNS